MLTRFAWHAYARMTKPVQAAFARGCRSCPSPTTSNGLYGDTTGTATMADQFVGPSAPGAGPAAAVRRRPERLRARLADRHARPLSARAQPCSG